MEKHLGHQYQQSTKYFRDSMTGRRLDWANMPESYKEFAGEYKVLPGPPAEGGKSLWRSLGERKSRRDFSGAGISNRELGRLAWAASGANRVTVRGDFYFRTAPSAGGLYPIETYVQINRVEGLQAGIYHYSVPKHGLCLLREGDFKSAMSEAALAQRMVGHADIVFLWTAVTGRTFWKYAQRGIRYIYTDVGHIGQNVYLAAAALELGCCAIGAFYDDEVNDLLGVDGEEETAVYMAAVGRVK